jgi:hypothetical protein
MKKSLLLAALLLSSAAQAETWVCSTPASIGGSNLVTFVRQDGKFTITLTTPAIREEKSETTELLPAEILIETDAMLTLVAVLPDGKFVGIDMINKITQQYVGDSLYFSEDSAREEGSCVMI